MDYKNSIEQMLTGLSADDTIDALESIRSEIMKKQKREACLAMHRYTVSQGKDGRWRTRIHLNNCIQMVSRSTREELENYLVELYSSDLKVLYISEVFDEWISERKEFREIKESSITRYNNEFKRYFPEDEPICKIQVDLITESDLELFIKRAIIKHSLTRKTYAQLRTLLNGIFKYAKREKYTKLSIGMFFNDLDLPESIFTRKKVLQDSEEVFSFEESGILISHLWSHPTIYNLGLILMFQTGIRVGELVALQWKDFNKDQLSIRISATEISYDVDGKRVFEVSDDAKTEEGNRTVFLPQQAVRTMNELWKLNPYGKYIFMNEGTRIRSKSMNYYLKKACREKKIAERSSHKIRKTYASTLILKKIDEKLIQKQLGHRDITTTKRYYDFALVQNAEILQKTISDAISY